MKLSVVVICWNSLENLRQLLESIPGALAGIDYEVILTDNGSTDGTAAFVAEKFPDVKYQRLDRNYGVAYARNRGIERTCGEYVWLLDDDTIINCEAAQTLIGYMESHPRCGVCACALRDVDGNLQLSYKPFPGLRLKARNLFGLETDDPYKAAVDAGRPFEPVYVIGACQLIRRGALRDAGLLDEKIFYGPEDADFCLRVREAAWSVAYLPQVSIIHKWKRITSRRPFSKIGREHIRALVYFYFKHRRFV
jgi:hypothetical protein amacA2_05673